MSYDYSDRFSNWQSGGAAVAVKETVVEIKAIEAAVEEKDISLSYLFSKDGDEWTEDELINLVVELAPEVTPSSFEVIDLWRLLVGIVGSRSTESEDNYSNIFYAYQDIEHPSHWCLFENNSWCDDSEVDTMPQSLMASLLIKEFSI